MAVKTHALMPDTVASSAATDTMTYAKGLQEGMRVEVDVIGFVGSTGNADPATPHLHFAIFELSPERLWWKRKAINPYPELVAAVSRAQ
ncbi:MAG: M23 family metallopeptidase [Candidatus Sulfotelmatobacter sp.]